LQQKKFFNWESSALAFTKLEPSVENILPGTSYVGQNLLKEPRKASVVSSETKSKSTALVARLLDIL